jgi:HD superfamily phosphohydrolase
MMKVQVGEIMNSVTGLRKLVSVQLPAKTAYRLKRIMDAVTSESTRIEHIRQELILKYADEQTEEDKKNKKPLQVNKKMQEFQKEFGNILEDEIEVNCYKIDFKEIENIQLSVQELTSLEPWFNIPEETPIIAEKTEAAELPEVPEPVDETEPVKE